MDQLILRKNRDLRHFDEVDWTILGWQDRRVPNEAEAHGMEGKTIDSNNTNTIIGFVYVGVLILFMLVYLT